MPARISECAARRVASKAAVCNVRLVFENIGFHFMKIAILGSGDVGQTLGAGLARLGHQVKMGTRDPSQEKVYAWASKTAHGASVGTFAEAAAFGELAILATLWQGTENVVRLADAKNLADKVVIDAVNPLDFSEGMPPKLAVSGNDSAGERIQAWLPRSLVVKAFNTVGNQHMIDPAFPGGVPDMFICGNDAGAKNKVTTLLKECGWAAVDLGGIENARYLEALAMIWIITYFRTSSGNHAFKLLRK